MKAQCIREVFIKMLEKYTNLEGVLFTTFSFSPEFFETYVLPLIIGDCSRDTPAQIAAADEALKEKNVVVIYDAAGLSEADKRLSFAAVPIRLQWEALFHPKIIFCYGVDNDGKPRHDFIVGSANLTRKGWGLNVEAAVWRQINTGSYLGWDLCSLLEHISRQVSKTDTVFLRDFIRLFPMKERHRWADPKTRLIWNNSGESLEVYILDHISDSSTLKICSPYFGGAKGIRELIESIREQADDLNITIIPGQDTGPKYNLSRHDAVMLLDEMPEVRWGTWKSCGEKNDPADRLVHAKIYALESSNGNRMAIGSHNFTKRGFGGDGTKKGKGNLEASIWFEPDEEETALPLTDLTKDTLIALCPEKNIGDAPNPVKAFCTVKVNWNSGKILVENIWPKENPAWEIRVPWSDKKLKFREKTYDLKEPEEVASGLLRTRMFTILGEDSKKYRGVISEEGWAVARPEINLESMEDILEAWLSQSAHEENQKGLRDIPEPGEREEDENDDDNDGGDGDVENNVEQEPDLFDSYFNIFRGVQHKRKRISETDGRKISEIRRMFFVSRTSVSAMVKLIKQSIDVAEDDLDKKMPRLTHNLVLLWELDNLCSEKEGYEHIRHDVKILRKEIRELVQEIVSRLNMLQIYLENRVRERPPFDNIKFEKVLNWFRKQMMEIET